MFQILQATTKMVTVKYLLFKLEAFIFNTKNCLYKIVTLYLVRIALSKNFTLFLVSYELIN